MRKQWILAGAAVVLGLAAAGCSSTGADGKAVAAHAGGVRHGSTAPLGTPPRPVGGHGLEAVIGGYDANHDGKVTREEFFGLRQERFKGADINGDGWLNEAEYVAEFEHRLKQQYFNEGRGPDEAYAQGIKQAGVRFSILDRDRDGRLTWEEDKASAERTFANYDTNGDGVISSEDPPRERPANTGSGN